MIYALINDGVYTGRTQSFDQKPDPNPVKKLEWLQFVDSGNPSFDPATQKLDPEVFTVADGKVTRSRPVANLSNQEKLEHVLRNRREAYHSETMKEKGITADNVSGLGFWIDAIAAELQERGEMQTDEMTALMKIRSKIKTDNPK